MPSSVQTIAYRIDAEDRLVFVSESWSEFARENDGSAVMPEYVLGRVLWSQMADLTVLDIYRRLVSLAREGRPTTFDYRCDAPAWRRVFCMTIAARPDGHVEFRSTLRFQTPRPALALLESRQRRDERLVRLCSWCHAIAVSADEWLPLETAVDRLQFLAGDSLPRLTHGICPKCAARFFPTLLATTRR